MVDDINIRPLKKDERDKLNQLWDDCGLTRPWNNVTTDIKVALAASETEIFVGLKDDKIIASIMVGFDGHRGWVYYLAVAPTFQGYGYGRTLVETAEAFLKQKSCPKVMLMVRPENRKAIKIYEKMGYEREDRALLVKWINQDIVEEELDHETTFFGKETRLPVQITYLEMFKRPTTKAKACPKLTSPITISKLENCSISFYRYLYNGVGEEWLWWEKRVADDETIRQIVESKETDIYLMSVGGVPAGWFQIDNLSSKGNLIATAEIAYFGLFPEFIGKGLGGYWLDYAIRTAWDHPSRPRRLILNTCTLDHPIALSNYQKYGFSPYRTEKILVEDPRLTGVIPAHIQLAQPAPFDPKELGYR